MDQFRNKQTVKAPHISVPQPRIAQQPVVEKRPKKEYFIAVIVAIVVVGLLLGVGYYVKKQITPVLTGLDQTRYQAVFLTNGQVYFGKLAPVDENTLKMSDIYYLQVAQKVQPEENTNNQEGTTEPQLIKLGEELHGPEDEMFIERQQVSFWENLKDGGKVVEAIKAYKK